MQNALITALSDLQYTENGALTHSTSGKHILDLFFQGPAMRRADTDSIISLFRKALDENADQAFKVLFYIRDIRGGQGERRFFRICAAYATAQNWDLTPYIVEYGRWDDYFAILSINPIIDNKIADLFKDACKRKDALWAKWMPREPKGPTKGDPAKWFTYKWVRKVLGLSPKDYRKALSRMSKTVEQQMSARKWDEINFSHVPSMAMLRYRKAFSRNAEDRFSAFLEAVSKGEVTIKAGTVYPHQIAANPGIEGSDEMWHALPDFVQEGVRFLPMIDVSGSMDSPASGTYKCVDVAIGLGMYLAERNKGDFKNYYLTFSEKPIFQRIIPTTTIDKKVDAVCNSEWGYNTDIEAAHQLIIERATARQVPQSDMPTHLIVLSDMEFDPCNAYTNTFTSAEVIKRMYKNAGYDAPILVWWNIQSRRGSTPVKADDEGNVLVGGFSPAIMQFLMEGDIPTPISMLLDVINSPRYNGIAVTTHS